MAVKSVDMVRKIRDENYQKTKTLSVQEQIEVVRKKSEKLQKTLKQYQCQTPSRL